jgi:tRNA (mo5U34)-methyltransferase
LDADELQEKLSSFLIWHYEFDFGDGVRTQVPDYGRVNRHNERRRYIFDALLQARGGSLNGCRVLDLGCNAGFFSLAAIEAGADFVLGVDGREEYIEQANLVFEGKGVERDRYRFERANIFEHDLSEPFDIVLCLGLLDVTSKPVSLFERMTRTGAEMIVIDSGLARVPLRSAFFEVSRLIEPKNAIDHDMVLVPTRQAVVELAEQFGFQIVPLALNIADYRGMDDYRDQHRLAFICAKSTPLGGLAAEPPQSSPLVARATRLTQRVRQLRG